MKPMPINNCVNRTTKTLFAIAGTNLDISSYLKAPSIALSAKGNVSNPSNVKTGISLLMTVPIIQR